MTTLQITRNEAEWLEENHQDEVKNLEVVETDTLSVTVQTDEETAQWIESVLWVEGPHGNLW